MSGATDLLLRPGLWPLLLLAPAAWLLLRRLEVRRERLLAEVAGPRSAPPAAGGSRRGAAGRVLFAGGVLMAAAAALEPAWGEDGPSPEPRGADIVLALDLSRSMEAREEGRSRLERARAAVAALVARARGDRLALVVFAGEARVAVPLTTDGDGLAALAAAADTDSPGRGGTDLGAALDAALAALRPRRGEEGDAAFVVLLTDGEDLGGRGRRAAAACAAAGATVHAVGFGSPRGAKIPLGPGASGFRRDREGRDVVTAMDPAGLGALAAAGGGAFVDGNAGDGVLAQLYQDKILPAARSRFAEGERRRRVPRFPWPLGAALLLWTVELCWLDPRRS